MKQTIIVKLCPSEEQKAKLVETMSKFNSACDYIATIAFKHRTASKFRLQKIVYSDIRTKFDLSAQLAIRAISKVCEAYKRDKNIKPKFSSKGSVVYDQRILSWKKLEAVSMLTTKGREIIPIVIGEYQRARLDRIRGQADLIFRNNKFFLCVVVEATEAPMIQPKGILGIDVGIAYLAADSDGILFSGKQINQTRKRYAKIKADLQSHGTKSAKRHLKNISGRESRFRKNTNHIISKNIVAKAKDTGRAIAIEDLNGIRSQTTVRKAQRSQHSSWGFGQLRSFIGYKAAIQGVPVIAVNPRGTSHTCPKCGINERANRPTRDQFRCIGCGFAGQADHVAAINIAARAAVNLPIVPLESLSHINSPSGTSPHALAVGC